MSALARLLLIPAMLSLWSSAAIAKDIPGLPKVLIGSFAKDAKACMTYYKIKAGKEKRPDKMPDFHDFYERDGKYYYSACGSRACTDQVLGYTKVKYGYVLYTKDPDSPVTPQDLKYPAGPLATPLGKNKFRLSFPPKGASIDVVRCPKNPFQDERP